MVNWKGSPWLLVLVLLWSIADASTSLPGCPEEAGWKCQWHTNIWKATSSDERFRDVSVTYEEKPTRQVSIFCGENTELPRGFLSNFTLGSTTYFRFIGCQQPRHFTLGEILDGETVKRLRFMASRPLGDALDANNFKGLPDVTYLNLMNNGLTSVPTNFFRNMPRLTAINLKDNALSHLAVDLFADVPKLENLELGYNNLTALNESMKGLQNLQVLNVYENNIQSVSRDFFQSTQFLRSVDLQGNHLEVFPEDVFADLQQLTTLNLFTNKLNVIPPRLFESLRNLKDLDMSDNVNIQTLPATLLQNLTSLKTINLSRCGLKFVPSEFFLNTPSLTTLHLNGNTLVSLTSDAFHGLSNLTFLDLSHNSITEIQNDVFRNLVSLKELCLNQNRIQHITQSAFYGTINLQKIQLNHNKLQNLPMDIFALTISLRHLDISYNSLHNVHRGPQMFNLPNSVRVLNLRHNRMRGIPKSWIIENTLLINLDLSDNAIQAFDITDCQPTSDNVTIDLRHNNITRIFIDLQLVEVLAAVNQAENSRQHAKREALLLLGHNPFVCDCEAGDFSRFIRSDLQQFFFKVDLEELQCQSPPRLLGELVSSVSLHDLTCGVPECPQSCSCQRFVDTVTEVDCSRRNLTVFPSVAPYNVSKLRLDGNRLTNISQLEDPQWRNLTQLHLNNNRIWSFDVKSLPTGLTLLDLSGNNIENISDATLQMLDRAPTTLEVWLGDNPWRCDCDAKPFKEWLNANAKRVGNLSAVQCNDTHAGVPLYKADLCPLQVPNLKEVLIVATIVSLVMAVGMAMVGIAFYRYQTEIKVWLYAHHLCLWFITENELDRDKKYDAFISFAQDDSEFVASHLLPGLECSSTENQQQPSYKVCIHYRDWLAGEWIPDQIIRSVQNSRRTIVVLSKNFMRSVWGRLEFKAAHHQALQDRTNRIIMVVLGDLPPSSEMDSELKMYVKFNTYLNWDDPWFWQKLRYAMPHNPLNKYSSSNRMSSSPPHYPLPNEPSLSPRNNNSKQKTDKIELVRT